MSRSLLISLSFSFERANFRSALLSAIIRSQNNRDRRVYRQLNGRADRYTPMFERPNSRRTRDVGIEIIMLSFVVAVSECEQTCVSSSSSSGRAWLVSLHCTTLHPAMNYHVSIYCIIYWQISNAYVHRNELICREDLRSLSSREARVYRKDHEYKTKRTSNTC